MEHDQQADHAQRQRQAADDGDECHALAARLVARDRGARADRARRDARDGGLARLALGVERALLEEGLVALARHDLDLDVDRTIPQRRAHADRRFLDRLGERHLARAAELEPGVAPITFHVGCSGKGQPAASTTAARNANSSPGRISLREGRTSRRSGNPVVVQRAVRAGFGAGAALADAAGAAAAGAGSPSRWTRVSVRVLRTLAVQF
jgi:hypothetical protein